METIKVKKEKKNRKPMANWVRWMVLLLAFLGVTFGIIFVSACGTMVQIMEQEVLEESREDMTILDQQVIRMTGEQIMTLLKVDGWEKTESFCRENDILYSLYNLSGRRLGGNLPVKEEKDATRLERFTLNEVGTQDLGTYGGKVILKIKVPEGWTRQVLEPLPQEQENPKIWVVLGWGFTIFWCLVMGWNLCKIKVPSFEVLSEIPREVYLALLFYLSYQLMLLLQSVLRRLGYLLVFPDESNMWFFALIYAGALTAICLLAILVRPGFYKHTICYFLLLCLIKLAKKIWIMWKEAVAGLPATWRMALGLGILSAAELAIILLVSREDFELGPFATRQELIRVVLVGAWAVEKMVFFPFVLSVAFTFRKFQQAAKELAAGNLDFQMKQEYMPGMFKEFREDMNAVASSVNIAVEEQMKSQRLKTELISNVSHDIKTPLTSIINFSDLISKEPCDNPKITEYSEHLHQQSSKLKKLIEDLMEASKVSTGNVEVHMEVCELKVLLGQCLGEYETLLAEHHMELVMKLAQEPVYVRADSRMLWRVLENLINNVRKYGMEHTRVFLDASREGQWAVVSIKNISKYPLETSPEELLERFVRGDKSRHTEGSGLGLSIVKSLMELMEGDIRLDVEGDMFKVKLYFQITEKPAVYMGVDSCQ